MGQSPDKGCLSISVARNSRWILWEPPANDMEAPTNQRNVVTPILPGLQTCTSTTSCAESIHPRPYYSVVGTLCTKDILHRTVADHTTAAPCRCTTTTLLDIPPCPRMPPSLLPRTCVTIKSGIPRPRCTISLGRASGFPSRHPHHSKYQIAHSWLPSFFLMKPQLTSKTVASGYDMPRSSH
jgi:hypothetical protein